MSHQSLHSAAHDKKYWYPTLQQDIWDKNIRVERKTFCGSDSMSMRSYRSQLQGSVQGNLPKMNSSAYLIKIVHQIYFIKEFTHISMILEMSIIVYSPIFISFYGESWHDRFKGRDYRVNDLIILLTTKKLISFWNFPWFDWQVLNMLNISNYQET